MRTRGYFKDLGTRTINGKRVSIAEHKLASYFRIGGKNIPAATLDEAIEKYAACQKDQPKAATRFTPDFL